VRRASGVLALCLAVGFSASLARAAEPVKHLRPKDYKGRVVAPKKGRVLLVNFWATWCEPCREELPALSSAAKGFSTKDLAVVLVSLDSEKTGPASVPKFLSSQKIPFVTWLVKSHDPQDFIDAVDKTWDGTLPYTVIYDRSGRLTARLAGKQSESSFQEAIRKAQGG
jgi:thiol-disulfide isomerase/thioredoxin